MNDASGRFIGYSKVQEDYLAKIKAKVAFRLQGKSLICKTATYPLAMAQSLGVMPKNMEKVN